MGAVVAVRKAADAGVASEQAGGGRGSTAVLRVLGEELGHLRVCHSVGGCVGAGN